MKMKKILLISIIAIVALALIITFVILTCNQKSEHVHNWSEWVTTIEPTCKTQGKQFRTCECGEKETERLPENENHSFDDGAVTTVATCTSEGLKTYTCLLCGKEETEAIQKSEHNYSVLTTITENSKPFVAMKCSYCDTVESERTPGIYFENGDELRLKDREKEFSFEVICHNGENYIRENLYIHDAFFINVDYGKSPEILVDYEIQKLSANRYKIKPLSPYEENRSYAVNLSGDITLSDYPTKNMMFEVAGSTESEIEYNDDIVYLSAMEKASPGYFPYELSFEEKTELYTLVLSKTGGFTQDYVGELLCIGEAECGEDLLKPTEEICVIGKIEAIGESNGELLILLGAPSLDEVFSKLNVKSESAPSNATLSVNEEEKSQLLSYIAEDDAFISALTAANISARTYASNHGLKARSSAFDPKNFSVELDANNLPDEQGNPRSDAFIVTLKITYTHNVPVTQGNTDLGSIDFEISFRAAMIFAINAHSNLTDANLSIIDKVVAGWNKQLYFDIELIQTTGVNFDLSSELNIKGAYESEKLYIINPNSGTIHSSDCRMCGKYLNDFSCQYNYSEVIKMPSYKEKACKLCKPFDESNKTFILNLDAETPIIHCSDCESAKRITHDKIITYSMYPVIAEYTIKNCQNCNPQNHTKTLAEYVSQSVQDSTWGKTFDMIKAAIKDNFKSAEKSPINTSDTPLAAFNLLCFEIPIYFKPQFNFDLKANFSFTYRYTVSDIYTINMRYNAAKNEKGETIGYQVVPNHTRYNLDEHFDLTVQGEALAEIGLYLDIRLGFTGLSKYIYAGIGGEVGAYAGMMGVLHADSDANNYYAARIDAGLYYQINLNYGIAGILDEDAISIIEKTYIPLFKSGDTKAYYAFSDYEQSYNASGSGEKALPDSLLSVIYFDLTDMSEKTGTLSWMGNEQYSVSVRFTDTSGKAIDYLSVKDGVLYVSDPAPEQFEAIMYVTVTDNIVASNLYEYITSENENGCAIFLEELTIGITVNKPLDERKILLEYFKKNLEPIYTNIPETEKITWKRTDDFATGKWFNSVGVFSASIFDFDSDNQKELMIISQSNYSPINGIVIELYEVNESGDVFISSVSPLNCYRTAFPESGISLDKYHGHPFAIDVTLFNDGDRNFILCTETVSPGCYEGYSHNYWIVEYDGHQINFVSSFWEYTVGTECSYWYMCEFVNGSLTNSKLYYESDFYDEKETGLYDTLKEARNAYFGKYQLNFDENSEKVSSSYNLLYTIFNYETIMDYDSDIIDFTSSLTLGLFEIPRSNQNIDQEDDEQKEHEQEHIPSNLIFELNDDEKSYSVVGMGECSDIHIVIPSTHNGLPVTRIGEEAFYEYDTFTDISIGSNIVEIEAYAFEYCSNLKNVYITDLSAWCKITFNGMYSNPLHNGSSGGTQLYLNKKLVSELVIPADVEKINEYAFVNCNSITTLIIPNNVTEIGAGAFYYCGKLWSVTIPKSLKNIDSGAFQNCHRLIEVINHSSLDIIKGSSDYGYISCYAMEVHTGESKIVNFNDYLFYTYEDANYLLGYVGDNTELTLPESYNGESYKIYNYAFVLNCNITNIVIPNCVTEIGSYIVFGCHNPLKITIKSKSTVISDNSFYYSSAIIEYCEET